ncbi:MAG: ATP-binding protein [Spartobacteria bacterium]|nr:ATP-binding protein [Spartobacteria bacterium]
MTNSCSSCGDNSTCPSAQQPGAACPSAQQAPARDEEQVLKNRLKQIKKKILVLSGKGGVGKSTVAANLALALEKTGRQVGLLDIDIHGPSIPKLLNLENRQLVSSEDGIEPMPLGGLKVMSIGFLLKDPDDALIWRGPMKHGVIKQFLTDVAWGELDFLIVDAPPGTGDEPLAVAQLLGDVDGAIIVTTPQDLAITDVRKSITFCHKLNMPVLGVIENMSGFVCPDCGARHDIFKSGGGETMAERLHVPFLGRIPIDPEIVRSSDSGVPHVHTHAEGASAQAFMQAVRPIIEML